MRTDDPRPQDRILSDRAYIHLRCARSAGRDAAIHARLGDADAARGAAAASVSHFRRALAALDRAIATH